MGVRGMLPGHDVVTAAFMGWAALSNGELIEQAEKAAFDVLITADRNQRYQQNIARRRIALVILGTNNWATISKDPDPIAGAVRTVGPGGLVEVAFPP